MLTLFKRYARELLIAVLISFLVSLALHFVLAKMFGAYLFFLISSSLSAFIAIGLLHKQFGDHLVSLFIKVDNISISSAEISHNLDQLKNQIFAQAQLSNDSADVIKQVSVDSGYLSSMTEATVDAAAGTRSECSKGSHDVEEIIQKIQGANAQAKYATDAVDKLLLTTKKIEKITEFVQSIATATNLLSLNAAISAAQAGVHGKSFAVIAGEIRKLSLQTSEAIKEINSTLQEIQTGTKDSANAMQALTTKINGIVETSNQIRVILQSINSTAITTERQSSQLAAALEEYVGTTDQVSDSVFEVKNNLEVIAAQSKLASDQSLGLTSVTEDMHATLFKFGMAKNKHDEVWRIADRISKQVGKVFEQAIATGQLSEDDVFDQNYLPIPGTNPPKYHTKFDYFTDAVLPNLQEPALNELDQLVFVIATDVNGYVPTHNIQFSQTLTGRYEVDLAKSRSKRIFNDRVGRRCGSHTEQLLLQTYKRDTGEVMHDLSVPVFVGGRHWGGVRVGYLAGYQDKIAA